MKLRTLILGAALPFAAAGWAQAADLAVADALPAGGGAVVTIGGHVREVLSGGTGVATGALTAGALFVKADTGNSGAKLVLQIDSTNPNLRLDKGTGLWVGGFWTGYDAMPNQGRGFTDLGVLGPDPAGVDLAKLTMGMFTVAVGEGKPEFADGTVQANATIGSTLGAMATGLTVGWANRTAGADATYVGASVGAAMGSGKWKLYADWGQNAGKAILSQIAAADAGTSYVVGAGFWFPLGGIFSTALDASWAHAVDGTHYGVAWGLNEQITSNVDGKQEVRYMDGKYSVEAWLNYSINGG